MLSERRDVIGGAKTVLVSWSARAAAEAQVGRNRVCALPEDPRNYLWVLAESQLWIHVF